MSSTPTALPEEAALGDHILFYLTTLPGAWMGSAMTRPGTWGHKPVSLEILTENTERVRGGGARRKPVRMRESRARGARVNQRCMENMKRNKKLRGGGDQRW